jgi:hypothetical protein
MTLPEPDDEFETFLKRRTVLPNGMSDDDKLEPPKALDSIVLKQAREAIRARQRLDRPPRWARPVALAATILLCLSIVVNVSLKTNRPAVSLRQMTASTADSASPLATTPANEGERREKGADVASSREAILPEAKIAEQRAPRPPVLAEANAPAPREPGRVDDSAVDKADALARRSAPVQASSKAPAAAGSAADQATQLADRGRTPDQAPSQTPSTANSAADPATQLADRGRTPAQAPGETPTSAANSATDRRASRAESGYAGSAAAQAPAAQAPPTSAGLPPSVAASSAASPSTASPSVPPSSASGNASASAASPATQPGDRVAEAQQRDEPALAKRKAGTAGPPHPQDPKTWLARIATLRAEGKTVQADAEMQRFRATFPAYPAKPDPSAPSEPPK